MQLLQQFLVEAAAVERLSTQEQTDETKEEDHHNH